jgi:phytol kinase
MNAASWPQQLLTLLAAGAWLVLATLAALAVRQRWPQHPEWSRKTVHIAVGPVVLICWALGLDRRVAVAAAAGFTLLALINHRQRLLPAIEDVGRPSYGTIAYGTSFTLLLALFWPDQPLTAMAGILVMALGDGLAGLLGPAIPSPSWQVLGGRRSLVGTTVMALTSWGVLAGLAELGSHLGAEVAVPSAAALVGIAATATLLEQVALVGLDNLTGPLAVAGLWSLACRP